MGKRGGFLVGGQRVLWAPPPGTMTKASMPLHPPPGKLELSTSTARRLATGSKSLLRIYLRHSVERLFWYQHQEKTVACFVPGADL
ncbi:hypothetical protein FALBO_17325 [Fusarium albosuccineum]|uniref:Uncharacterized protein n=1 Tax=Fusarium albosuccineum TaxID=1237068 RepID=A0A8H4NR40_9HYPO|nr:hypothetical protein FALBO_17325 [Fusarium albosuccineum]